MALLSKADIIGKKDLESREVEVPEWGGSVIVKMMNGAERDEFQHEIQGRNDDKGIDLRGLKAKLVGMCLIDADGEQLFQGLEGIEELNQKSPVVIDKLFDEAQDLNGLGQTAVEDAEKN